MLQEVQNTAPEKGLMSSKKYLKKLKTTHKSTNQWQMNGLI